MVGRMVFQIPSTPWVAEARPIGFVRLRLGGSGESGCLIELGRCGRGARPGTEGSAAEPQGCTHAGRRDVRSREGCVHTAAVASPDPNAAGSARQGGGHAMDGEGDHAHAVRGDSRLLR